MQVAGGTVMQYRHQGLQSASRVYHLKVAQRGEILLCTHLAGACRLTCNLYMSGARGLTSPWIHVVWECPVIAQPVKRDPATWPLLRAHPSRLTSYKWLHCTHTQLCKPHDGEAPLPSRPARLSMDMQGHETRHCGRSWSCHGVPTPHSPYCYNCKRIGASLLRCCHLLPVTSRSRTATIRSPARAAALPWCPPTPNTAASQLLSSTKALRCSHLVQLQVECCRKVCRKG